jgi:hypothetical protein
VIIKEEEIQLTDFMVDFNENMNKDFMKTYKPKEIDERYLD